MSEDELKAVFAKMAGGRAAEVVEEMVAAGQPLVALTVAGHLRQSDWDDRVAGLVAEAVAAVEAEIDRGELDPVVAGAVMWTGGPFSPCKLVAGLGETSPLWKGIAGDCFGFGDHRLVPAHPRAVAGLGGVVCAQLADSTDALGRVVWAGTGPVNDNVIQLALAADDLDRPLATAIVITFAGRCGWRVTGRSLANFAAGIARARSPTPSPPVTLVLPPLII